MILKLQIKRTTMKKTSLAVQQLSETGKNRYCKDRITKIAEMEKLAEKIIIHLFKSIYPFLECNKQFSQWKFLIIFCIKPFYFSLSLRETMRELYLSVAKKLHIFFIYKFFGSC